MAQQPITEGRAQVHGWVRSEQMEYYCRVGAPSGQIQEGIFVADSEARLRHDFEAKGLYVFSIQPRGLAARLPLKLPARRRLRTRDFLIFNQELATLLKAGLPLVQSLDILRQRLPDPSFKAVLDDVHERVRGGTALSDAFAAHGDLFPRVYTASLMAGEKSGGLEQVLRRYVAYAKVLGAVKRRTLSALIYPIVLIVLSIVVVAIIVIRVIPSFEEFYRNFGADLPLGTRIIVNISTMVRQYLPFLIGGGALALLFGWGTLTSGRVRTRLDRLLLKAPFVGATAQQFATSQLARTLATLLGGGIPLVNSLEIAARSVSNRHLASELQDVSQRVREGESLTSALAAKSVVPDVALKMVEVGESTGALQDMLNSLADFYDEEIETALGRFVALVEPALLVIMGIVIGSLLLALYFPLIRLMSVVGG